MLRYARGTQVKATIMEAGQTLRALTKLVGRVALMRSTAARGPSPERRDWEPKK